MNWFQSSQKPSAEASAGSTSQPAAARLTPKILLRLIIAVLAVTTVMLVLNSGFQWSQLGRTIEDMELKTYDFRASTKFLQSQRRPSQDIVIVEFDDSTLNLLQDDYGTWPWPRKIHADMMGWFERVGVRAIAYDIMFVSHQKGQEASDEALIKAFQKYPDVYLGMNFDNDLMISQQLGRPFTKGDIDLIEPMALPLTIRTQEDSEGQDAFFANPGLTFNHYRALMPGLMSVKDRLGFVNHQRDVDGISRTNGLMFRLNTHVPVISPNGPYVFDETEGVWYDAHHQLINSRGMFLLKYPAFSGNKPYHFDEVARRWLDAENELITRQGQLMRKVEMPYSGYYPYMGLRLLLALRYPGEIPEMTLSENGTLNFGAHHIPLSDQGTFYINWYTNNVSRDELMAYRNQITEAMRGVQHNQNMSESDRATNLSKLSDILQKLDAQLSQMNSVEPYHRVSAWQVIKAMRDAHRPNVSKHEQEQNAMLAKFLRNKIVFVGTTALATYDIKSTPISPLLPGVILQATMFDNLYQNNFYLRRATPNANLIITLLICLVVAAASFQSRSATTGFLLAMAMGVLYVISAVVLFSHAGYWINVAIPIVAIILTTTVVYMVKYILRDKDYEKTYVMATTDSMTGLFNHRFFQEHMRLSMERASRAGDKFSLVLIDIDRFKIFNDTYGHQAGDEVLRCVARKLQKSVRSVDIVCRYGGEELAVVLDKATEEEALEVARKLVKAVAEEPYPIAEGASRYVSISCGVSTFPTHGTTTQELIDFSDQGLYRAKECGRNQVGAQRDEDMVEKQEVDLNVVNGLIRPEESPLGKPRDTFKQVS
ncbi:MAG: diguanylate cyclase [Candidatus Melainabacteria bacterium]